MVSAGYRASETLERTRDGQRRKQKKKKKTPRQIQQENENETKLVAPIAPTPIILGNKPLKKNIMHGEKNATLNSSPENKKKSHQKQRDIGTAKKIYSRLGGNKQQKKADFKKKKTQEMRDV